MATKTILIAAIFLILQVLSVRAAETGDPLFDATYHAGSGVCADCHNGLVDAGGNDISIETDWSTSMMANSSRDPYWRAKVASELHRNPALSDEINDKCSRCHAPMANDSSQKEGNLPLIFTEGVDIGFLDPANTAYFDMAMDGVSCSLCHQIRDDGDLGTLAGVSGKYRIADYIADGTQRIDRPIYGQYADPNTNPMRNIDEFTPQLGVHTSTSELCASCHDLKTPFVDGNGDLVSTTPESEFPEQMVYSEWNNSDYADGRPLARSCQQCHMPVVGDNVQIANRPSNLPFRAGFSRHKFLGANTVMMDMLDRNALALGVSAAGFASAIAETRQFLQQAASIGIDDLVLAEGELVADLRVRNAAGHKFPSGYPSRRAYIHFTVRNAAGDPVFESGLINADGSISGVATDADSSQYEPHYQTITQASQVQVYEPIMADSDGAVTHTLLRAGSYLKDNRLLPLGFDIQNAPSDVAVRGLAASDPDFVAGQDSIRYRVDISSIPVDPAEDVTIEAEIRYQPLAYGHLQDLFQDGAAVAQVSDFQKMFDDPNTLRDELVDSVKVTLSSSTGCYGDDITLDDIRIDSGFSCTASNSIIADVFTVGGTGNARFSAPAIRLLPGFSVLAGGVFTAN